MESMTLVLLQKNAAVGRSDLQKAASFVKKNRPASQVKLKK